MRISLLRISLLRYFKTFHENLPFANIGYFISFVQFLLVQQFFDILFLYCDLVKPNMIVALHVLQCLAVGRALNHVIAIKDGEKKRAELYQKEADQRFLDSVLQCKIRTAEKVEAQNSGPALYVQRRKSVNLLE